MIQQSRREKNRQERESGILDAALEVFSNQGFSAATMDDIAAFAGVPKPTLYSYFASKDALFKAVLLTPRDSLLLAIEAGKTADHVRQLWAFAWSYARTVMRPDLLSLARLIIAEAHRFPEIGRAYQANGPDKVLEGLMKFMTSQKNSGNLKFDDAELCAQDFWGLILSAPRNKALHDPDAIPSQPELHRYISNGLGVFLRAYSIHPERDLARLDTLASVDLNEPDHENEVGKAKPN